MIVPYQTLVSMQQLLVGHDDVSFVNPASIDIRIGKKMLVEINSQSMMEVDLTVHNEENPYMLLPGAFSLISTYEKLHVPIDMAMELKLKSSSARMGYNHSMAFWFDPGWNGIGTMEVSNINKFTSLPLWYGMKFAQIIYHKLTEPCDKPYNGRYQNAITVEGKKSEIIY